MGVLSLGIHANSKCSTWNIRHRRPYRTAQELTSLEPLFKSVSFCFVLFHSALPWQKRSPADATALPARTPNNASYTKHLPKIQRKFLGICGSTINLFPALL
jgi:hypothetical protein